jgi:hypothetical protein
LYDLTRVVGLPSKSELQQRGALTESGNMNKEIPMEQLLQSIHLDYGFFLHHLGNITAAGISSVSIEFSSCWFYFE